MSSYPSTVTSPFDEWLTIKLLAEAEPAFTEPAIRNHVFNAVPRTTSKGPIPGNGLAPHIRRIGSKVLIHHAGFRCWIDESVPALDTVSDQCAPSSAIPDSQKPDACSVGKESRAAKTSRPASKLPTSTTHEGGNAHSQQVSRRRI